MAWNGIRNKEVSFMGIPFKEQSCPSCGTVVEFMALGKDARRDEMICAYCSEPELFVETEPDEQLLAQVDNILNED